MEVAQHRTAQKTHSKPHLTLRKIQDLISSNTADFCVLRSVWKTATLKNMEELQQIMESKKQLIKFGQNGN